MAWAEATRPLRYDLVAPRWVTRLLKALRSRRRRCEMMLGTRQVSRCRGSFHQEESVAPPAGIKRKRTSGDITIPDFQLDPDAVPGIAQVIVNFWTGDASLANILDRNTTGPKKGMATPIARQQATDAINKAAPHYNFTQCVIISEQEHDEGYTMEDENDLVFVLPNKGRVNPAGADLLSSAKLLMACTPNGI
jgi:hypothetical protein